MVLSKREREQMLTHCGAIHEDDGIDPKKFFKEGHAHKTENCKTKQLCRQIATTLHQIFSGELGDDVLSSLAVSSVEPAPDASRLMVTICPTSAAQDFDRGLVEARLSRCVGRLRSEVASAITRRKTPTLIFNVASPVFALQDFE